MSTREKAAVDSPLGRVAIFLVSLLISYSLFQNWYNVDENKANATENFLAIYEWSCNQGITLPNHSCALPLRQSIANQRHHDLNTAIPLLPNLKGSLDYLGEFKGSEAEAARYISLLYSIEKGRKHQYRENHTALPHTVKNLFGIWQSSPLLVAGSACTFCYNHSEKMQDLIEASSIEDNTIKKLVLNETYYAYLVATSNSITSNTISHSELHAALSSAGSSYTAKKIARELLERKNWDSLNLWVNKGLNGSRSLSNLDLTKVPINIVVSAWEQGASIGYDQPDLTRYLVSTGYRPALRWLIWLLGTDYQYLKGHNFSREVNRYTQILTTFTAFQSRTGEQLVQFYNEKWQDIFWNGSNKKWMTK